MPGRSIQCVIVYPATLPLNLTHCCQYKVRSQWRIYKEKFEHRKDKKFFNFMEFLGQFGKI